MPFPSQESLANHFYKHGPEFNATSSADYVRKAEAFLLGPLPAGVLECAQSQGHYIRYNPTTDEYGVLARDRVTILTYNRPTRGLNLPRGLRYFQEKCSE